MSFVPLLKPRGYWDPVEVVGDVTGMDDLRELKSAQFTLKLSYIPEL